MKDIELTVSDIKDLMGAFDKSGLGSFKLQQGSFKLELEGRKASQLETAAPVQAVKAETEATGENIPVPAPPRGDVVKSPIVGTFYSAPAPDKKPYVKPGSIVKKGDVLFIIESMKLMNEIVSEFDGKVGEVLAQDGAAVEYGQPIMTIE